MIPPLAVFVSVPAREFLDSEEEWHVNVAHIAAWHGNAAGGTIVRLVGGHRLSTTLTPEEFLQRLDDVANAAAPA